MTILIVQGPHADGISSAGDAWRSLRPLARAAGRTLAICKCSGLTDLVTLIRRARASGTEFMLLDPGLLAQQAMAHPESGLHDALDELHSPYIEVHDDSSTTLDAMDFHHAGPLATIVINGDLATSYRIAMGVALRFLAA